MADVVTVGEAVQRSKAEGLPVTEYALRGWVKSGAIPCRKVGNKALLFFPNVVAFLKCETGVDNPSAPIVTGGIRRVDRG